MPYDVDSILESERCKEILIHINMYDEGRYSAEIAEEIDCKQQLASEVIKVLEEAGLVKKGKRNKAQYYVTTDRGEKLARTLDEIIQKKGRISNLERKAEKLVKNEEMDILC